MHACMAANVAPRGCGCRRAALVKLLDPAKCALALVALPPSDRHATMRVLPLGTHMVHKQVN